MRTVLVILPPNQRYYQDRDVFALLPEFDPVYMTDTPIQLRGMRANARILPAKYLSHRGLPVGASSVLGSVPELDEVVAQVSPALIVTFELHSRISSSVASLRIKTGNQFRHLVVAYETAELNVGAWSFYPTTRFSAIRTARIVDRCLAYSTKARNALISSGVDPKSIIQSFPGVYQLAKPHTKPEGVPGRSTILFIGALRRNKGVLTLLKAMATIASLPSVRSQHPVLTIAGAGPLSNRIRRAADRTDWLDFRGVISESDKETLLATARVFVYPSEDTRLGPIIRWEEQTATSVLEAMSAGLPVIASNSGSLPEVIQRDESIFPQGSTKALASRIVDLLVHETIREQQARENQERARREFDIRSIAEYIAKRIEEN